MSAAEARPRSRTRARPRPAPAPDPVPRSRSDARDQVRAAVTIEPAPARAPRPPVAPTRRRPRPAPRPAPERRVAARSTGRRRSGALPGVLLVALVGLLLGGVVSLQVAALRANMAAGDVRRETRRVQADVGNLQAVIAQETSEEKIAAAARSLGMVYAPVDAVRTVRLRRAGAAG